MVKNLTFACILCFKTAVLFANEKPAGFTPDTLVTKANGSVVAIGDLSVEDEVLAFDAFTGEKNVKAKVKQIVKRPISEAGLLIILKINGEFLKMDGHHPIFVLEHNQAEPEWKKAADLVESDLLIDAEGRLVSLDSISRKKASTIKRHSEIVDLEIEHFHTFYVGKNRILAHNFLGELASVIISTTISTYVNNLVTDYYQSHREKDDIPRQRL